MRWEPGFKDWWEYIPDTRDARDLAPLDLLFCHRRGFSSSVIRGVERVRHADGARWSHVAVVGRGELVEALTSDVTRSPLDTYHDIEYMVTRTGKAMCWGNDREEGLDFLYSCVGQHYAWFTGFVTGLGLLTGGTLWGGLNGTEMCSGLAAQTLVRGPFNFTKNPASLAPAELACDLHVPESLHKARLHA